MEQAGASPAPTATAAEAKTENFLSRRVEPQCGQRVPCHSAELTRTSLACLQALQ